MARRPATPRETAQQALLRTAAALRRRRKAEAKLNIAIGLRLRWARELVYPTTALFGEALGVDKSLISLMENGERSISPLNLVTAANKLLVGTEYLLTGDLSAVEVSMRRALVDRHPELIQPDWEPDPRAPTGLLVPHRVDPRPPSGRQRKRSDPSLPGNDPDADTDAPFPPTKPTAAMKD